MPVALHRTSVTHCILRQHGACTRVLRSGAEGAADDPATDEQTYGGRRDCGRRARVRYGWLLAAPLHCTCARQRPRRQRRRCGGGRDVCHTGSNPGLADRSAPHAYDLLLDRDEWMFGWQQLKPLIAPLLPCAPRVLDLGCGTSRCAPCRALRPWPYPIPNPNPNPTPTLTLTLTPTPTLTLTLALT